MNAIAKKKPTPVYIREVAARYRRGRRVLQKISDARGVWDFARKVVWDNSKEHFIALYLDGAHQVVSFSVVSIGTATSCLVHPRELYQQAILSGAVAVIVAHNHPSGNLSPSKEDHRITQQLARAGELIGIQLLDHVVFTDEGYTSFVERGWLSATS